MRWILGLVVTLAVLAQGCGPTSVASQPDASDTGQPSAVLPSVVAPSVGGPGYIHLVGDPPDAAKSLTIALIAPDGSPSGRSDEFGIGQQIVLDRASMPGRFGVAVNNFPCDGQFRVDADREVDLILRIDEEKCTVVEERSHPPGEIDHQDVLGLVSGEAPLGASIRIISLTGPPASPVMSLDVDESGLFESDPLPAGRYRIELITNGSFTGSVAVELEAGENEHVDLTALR